ncbi:protein spire isoform X2 [Cephus cinctus]|uniref:Protein spire isoform X2 n=1 Tax=Cephus cinctus TaxID=211228 RepID=A0AAJ7BQX8_CEPCN|nr:protein spire isoform X2 [Cephus cinctus]
MTDHPDAHPASEECSPMNVEDNDDEPSNFQNRIKKRMKRPKCKLNSDGYINLQDILLSFNGPISQEQAWALCYQAAKSFSCLPRREYQELSELSQILLHKDGNILADCKTGSEDAPVSERKLVFSLGMMVYEALDFGVAEKEERPLSSDLEALITLMTHFGEESELDNDERLQETDDEGIERDSGESELDELLLHRNTDVYGVNRTSVCSLESVLRLCTKHMQGTNEQADVHYRAVIRALVAEALELSQFLEKVAIEKKRTIFGDGIDVDDTRDGTVSTQPLHALDFKDWTDVRIWRAIQARFWVQVIGELRRGVKLKKVEAGLGKRGSIRGLGRGAEFELTPYEILMDDIRARRYRLRKTPTPSPQLRKDAHAVILEFIRSRPPLKKVSERKLPPLKKQCTPRELLMESIKRPPRPLRPSHGAANGRLQQCDLQEASKRYDHAQENANGKENSSAITPKSLRRGSADLSHAVLRQPRRLIPVDFDLKLDGGEEEEDEDEEFVVTRFEDEDEAANYWQSKGELEGKRLEGNRQDDEDDKESANPWRKTGGLRLTRNEYHRFCDAQLESYDLATQCPSRRASARKHATVTNLSLSSFVSGTTSLPHSRPHSRQHRHEGMTGTMNLSPGPSPGSSLGPSPTVSPRPRARPRSKPSGSIEDKSNEDQNAEWQKESADEQKPSLGDMFLDERLSLTLEEIVHIRSVLTKAELESLPVEGRVKEDVEKRRVCFLCLKTRFGLLGPWGQRCRLCERTVCVKCYSKMRIPTEHFSHVPVVLLSPGLLLSPSSSEPDSGTRSPWLRPAGGVGSAPASPAARRRNSAMRTSTPSSTPMITPAGTPTPAGTQTPPPNGRRDDDPGSVDKRGYRSAGSPAKLSTTAAFNDLGGLSAEQRLAAERLRGVAMVVCHDCRIMVIQIIKSSRTTRATIRNNVISRLTLNLSPVYV